jgi:hypothetical protein
MPECSYNSCSCVHIRECACYSCSYVCIEHACYTSFYVCIGERAFDSCSCVVYMNVLAIQAFVYT